MCLSNRSWAKQPAKTNNLINLVLASCLLLPTLAIAQQNQDPPGEPRQEEQQRDRRDRERENPVSPVRNIERDRPTRVEPAPVFDVRSFDGSNNSLEQESMGAANSQLLRYTSIGYSDGISSLAGEDRLSPRSISNIIFAQSHDVANHKQATDFLWQWGQFLDHDLDLTDGVDPAENAYIDVPLGDVFFDPQGTGTVQIPFNRSVYDTATGTSTDNPRQQINEITAWIDASNVYGSSQERALALRTMDGTGQLKTSDGDLLPFNTDGLANAGSRTDFFLAGDVRANEQVGLASMHTLFVREHNRQARRIARDNPSLSGEEIFQQARAIVGAQMQVITYREFLPLLLGRDAMPRYRGYNPDIDAGIANEFSTAAYRLGHSLLSAQILRLDAEGNEIDAGHLALRDAFFSPNEIVEQGIEPILRGLASQVCQSIDNYVIDDVRNFLFGAPGAGGFDLASLNIQRGRDHGLASYNQARFDLGLRPVRDFADISSDPLVQAALEEAYADVDAIDLWVGGLAEDHHRDAMVGEVFYHILKRQFLALRDGDRFWYQNALPREVQRTVERTRLSDIIRRNTDIGEELQANVFVSASAQQDQGDGGGQDGRRPRNGGS